MSYPKQNFYTNHNSAVWEYNIQGSCVRITDTFDEYGQTIDSKTTINSVWQSLPFNDFIDQPQEIIDQENNLICELTTPDDTDVYDEYDYYDYYDYYIVDSFDTITRDIPIQVLMDNITKYKCKRCFRSELMDQIKILTYILPKLHTRNEKISLCNVLFDLLLENQWFMKENANFRKTVQEKISEFKYINVSFDGSELKPDHLNLANWPTQRWIQDKKSANLYDKSIVKINKTFVQE